MRFVQLSQVRVWRRSGAFGARWRARGGAPGVRARGHGGCARRYMQGAPHRHLTALRAHARLPHHRPAHGYRRSEFVGGVSGGAKDEHDVRIRGAGNQVRARLPPGLLRRGRRAGQGQQRSGAGTSHARRRRGGMRGGG